MNRPTKYDTATALNRLIDKYHRSNDDSVIVEIWNGESCIKSDVDMATAPYDAAMHLAEYPKCSVWMEVLGRKWVEVRGVDVAKANRRAMRTLYRTGVLPISKALSLPTKKRMYVFLRDCGWVNRGHSWFSDDAPGERFTVAGAFARQTGTNKKKDNT